MDFLQNLIHKLEVGGGMRYFRVGALLLVVVIAALLFDAGAAKNMTTSEGMDAAQVARNLARGKGFTTFFIRPFSISLVREHNQEKHGLPELGQKFDDARLNGNHPDLANPPVYPFVLAGLMKVAHFRYPVDTSHPFWSIPKARITEEGGRQFWRYQPDFLIAFFNQALFLAVVVLVFFLARRLFDVRTAWLAAGLVFGTELFWRFTVSGLSTLLALVVFTGLLWCLVWLEEELREPRWGRGRLFLLAALTGALVGLGALTRYSLGWLILPVLAFLLLFSGKQRLLLAAVAFVAFAVVLMPWVARNYKVSGTPFGTAGYAIAQGAGGFPEHQLERSLAPDLSRVGFQSLRQKFLLNLRPIVQNDLPRLGGNWLVAFFLVGLLVNFANPAARRLRHFLLMCLGVFVFVQALGRTQLSEDSPEVNSENLFILLAPLVVVYGASLFYLLLDQLEFRLREIRYAVIGGFCAVVCLPLLLTLVPAASSILLHFQVPLGEPLAYPPYYPPSIQSAAGWCKADELTMSDMPWAVAWYGQSQCVWLTLRAAPDVRELKARKGEKPTPQEDFFALNDYEKPIQALYLTRVTLDKLDSRMLTPAYLSGDQSWGSLIYQLLQFYPRDPRNPRPWPAPVNLMLLQASGANTSLPLRFWQYGWPESVLLTAREDRLNRP
jgi:4-amino-4-deoxy-L-arabinose transferase-like glycosyltransferase